MNENSYIGITSVIYEKDFSTLGGWIRSIQDLFLMDSPKFFIFLTNETQKLQKYIHKHSLLNLNRFMIHEIPLHSEPFFSHFLPFYVKNILMNLSSYPIHISSLFYISNQFLFLTPFSSILYPTHKIYFMDDSYQYSHQPSPYFFGGNILHLKHWLYDWIYLNTLSTLQDQHSHQVVQKAKEDALQKYSKYIQFIKIPPHEIIRVPRTLPSQKLLFIHNYGGLGNIFFQIATGLSLAIQYNLTPCILYNEKHREDSRAPTYRDSSCRYQFFQNIYRIHKNELSSMRFLEYKEESMSYEERIHNHFQQNLKYGNMNHFSILGYFQSTKYFEKYWDYIQSNFLYLEMKQLSKIILQSYSKTFSSPKKYIGIHIRGTDYLTSSHYHLNIPISYYTSILDKYSSSDEYHFIIFTDDKNYVESLQDLKNYSYEYASEILDKYKIENYEYLVGNDEFEMLFMSEMNIFICANSTFSLFGSYLSQAEKVYLPSRWIVSNQVNVSEFILKDRNYEIIEIN